MNSAKRKLLSKEGYVMAVGLSAAEDHPVNEVLPFGQMFIYGLQHVFKQ